MYGKYVAFAMKNVTKMLFCKSLQHFLCMYEINVRNFAVGNSEGAADCSAVSGRPLLPEKIMKRNI